MSEFDLEAMTGNMIETVLENIPEHYLPTQRADEVFWQLSEIEENNGLYPLEFNTVFNAFVKYYNGGVS